MMSGACLRSAPGAPPHPTDLTNIAVDYAPNDVTTETQA
jgi:hypothetical protein